MRRLEGKVVAVTGGASGIGAEAAARILREGGMVCIGDIDRISAERMVERAKSLDALDRFHFQVADVNQETDVIQLLEGAVGRFGRLDGIVNNAGTGGAYTRILDTTSEDWDRTMQLNLRSVFWGTKHAARIMIDNGWGGSIVNVSSAAAINGGSGSGAYSASKGAVESFSLVAATQFGPHRIRVNCVSPGVIVTPMMHRNIEPEALLELAKTMQPLPIAGVPEHVAPAIAFFLSSDSEFITATSLLIDGGARGKGDDLFGGVHPYGRAVFERAMKAGVVTFDVGSRVQAASATPLLDEWEQAHPRPAPTESRLVVVTGAGKGLGRSMCRVLARLGHRLIACSRSESSVEELRSEFGEPHDVQQVDVGDARRVEEWARDVVSRHGAPDIILNNAGVLGAMKQVWRVEESELDEILRTNVHGTVNVIRSFMTDLIRTKKGVVVNFSSGWGRGTAPRVGAYCSSKWAIEGLTKAMSQEVPRFMSVVTLHPGHIQTDTLRAGFGEAAGLYPTPDEWAEVAVPYLLRISTRENGKQLTVPGMDKFRGFGKFTMSQAPIPQ